MDEVSINGEQQNSGIIHHFVDGILSGKGHEISGRDGYNALHVILAGLEPQKLEKVIAMPAMNT
ncbi:hypothetical protein GC096_21450 [Paenibacillus sp. LMG 31461]|uniref:Uncharacterized protein n=1 Tax=Paenibacillus plantarum TaxID=2654975 RepID=A0ABX1XDQ4_9BACL|nr:hypothetical protein [Paenibacillus plantarum]NOU66613.1 hypothetical protein [Paenibacillus plantarum]